MGRGSSSSSRKSKESAALSLVHSASKKKAGTWEAPKSNSLLPRSLHDELNNTELDIRKKMEMHILLAERQVDQLKGHIEAALIYLPRDVQHMNVRDYFQRFGGNLSTFADHEKKRVMNINSHKTNEIATKRRSAARKKIAEVASARSLKKGNDTMNSSSGSSSFLNLTSATVPSTPAHGTSLSASNNLVTVHAKKTPGGTASNVVSLLVGSNYVEMTENSLRTLDSAQRETAGQQLENLSAKLQNLQQLLWPEKKRDN